MKNTTKNKVILASGSPRRKELLATLGIDFDIIVADIDESIDKSQIIENEIQRLAHNKAQAIFKLHQDKIVIGSDTVVVINNEILGKPKDKESAREMLNRLSGNKHQVITALSIISPNGSDDIVSVSDVYFDKLSEKEIEEYLDTNEPYDKAGAYAIQGGAAKFINRIDGDYYAIIGLPVNKVYQLLKKHL